MKESIEEVIELLHRIDIKNFLSGMVEQSDYIVDKANEVNEAIEYILSDYKRVLKENEKLKGEKEQAWEEWNNLEQGSYETEQRLKQQIKKLQKESEELKEYIAIAPNLDEMTATKYRNIQQDAYIQGRAEEQQKAEQIIYENYIPKQKIKDKLGQAEEHLIDVDKRIEQTTISEEEEIVLWVIGVRLTERIKVFKELLGKATDNLNTKFVSKIKIKEKIGKLERELDFYAGREHAEWQDGEFDVNVCHDLSMQIKALKELLEEEE